MPPNTSHPAHFLKRFQTQGTSAWHDEGREHICRVCKIGHQTFLSFSVNFLFKVPERFECLAPSYQVPGAQLFFAEQSAPRAPPA